MFKFLFLLSLFLNCNIKNKNPVLKFFFSLGSQITSSNPINLPVPQTIPTNNDPILEYSLSQFNLITNTIQLIKPNQFQNINSCSISELIGFGLNFNTTTCEISGIPNSYFPNKTFKITGIGNNTNVERNLTLYSDFSPDFNFPRNRKTFYQNQLAPRQIPILTGQISEFTISPSLPAGLSINTSTGQISGTPTITSIETEYQITAKSLMGSKTKSIFIRVGDYTAKTVYGQNGSFTTNTPNITGVTANTLNRPEAATFDKDDNLYISDRDNNRVLFYPKGSTTATRVYGQNGNFNTNVAGTSATNLSLPLDSALDSNGNLYVSDYNNHRLLFFLNGSTTATVVYGQNGNFNTNISGVTNTNLNGPRGIILDSNDNLYLIEFLNHRGLVFPKDTTTATKVFGQFGSFTTNNVNNSGISANSLSSPCYFFVNHLNQVYIADYANHRILFYETGSTTASRVYGQNGNFNTNSSGTNANSLSAPYSITADEDTGVYISDFSNNRVLFFHSGATTASNVIGQNDFVSNSAGISADKFNNPIKVILDSTGALCVAEYGNSRVMCF